MTKITIDRAVLEQALDALESVDSLIEHQYTGTRDGMNALQNASDDVQEALTAARAALAQPQGGLTDEEIETLAHRMATKYTHRSDPTSHSYGFVRHTLIDFARKILEAQGEQQ